LTGFFYLQDEQKIKAQKRLLFFVYRTADEMQDFWINKMIKNRNDA